MKRHCTSTPSPSPAELPGDVPGVTAVIGFTVADSRTHPAGVGQRLGAAVLACLFQASVVPVARAVDWTAGPGDFGTAGNWSGGIVPSGDTTPVNIANGGSAQIDLPGSYTIGSLMLGNHAGQGSIVQTGGCLNTRRIIIGGDDSSGGTGEGHYAITDGTLRSVADEIWIGSKGGEGTMVLSGSSLVSSASWIVIGRDGASGNLTLSDSAELHSLAGNVPVGCNSNGFTSTLELADSSRIAAANEIWVGWIGNHSNHGIMRLSGNATASTGNGLVIGRNGAKGTVVLSGNSSLDVGGHFVCGADPGSSGELTIRDEAHVHAGKQVLIGLGGSTGKITIEGGCLTGHAVPGEDASGAGISFRSDGALTVNGGKVSTPGFINSGSNARLVFNGGLLRATGTTTSGGFFANFAAGDLWIGPRGMTFDTKALAIEVEQSLGGEGKLSKRGTGSLVLEGAAGHAGDTEITQGTLILNSPFLSDAHRVLISGGGSRLRLSHGQTDRVAKLVIDGVAMPSGRYEAPGNPGSGTEIPQLEGSGALEVRFGPGQLTFADWIDQQSPASGFDEDTDGDGIENGVEQVFGSDPNAATPLPRLQQQAGGLAVLAHPLAASVAVDVTYIYEWSRDLHTWHRTGETDSSGTRVDITTVPSAGSVEARYQIISGSPAELFGRVVASQSILP